MVTLSLTGESTLYPRVCELIGLTKSRGMFTFLVTNGSTPQVLGSMDPLPTQLYVSSPEAERDTYVQLARPALPNAWERFDETIDLLPSLSTRKALRLTMLRGRNMSDPKAYSRLVAKGSQTSSR